MLDLINGAIDALSSMVFAKVSLGPIDIELVVLWLAIPMLFFTAWLKFANFRYIGLGLRILRGKFREPDAPGQMSQFGALSTALSGTIGLGNIAGVAIALTLGGPGAAFWMFCIGWFAMALKCAEVTLGLKYREVDGDGRIRGGPMYSIKNGFKERGWARFGLILGGVYAGCALLGAIPLIQVNQSYAQVSFITGFDAPWTFGIFLAAMVGIVIFSGVAWLSRVTSTIVPLMGIIYLTGVFAIIALNIAELPAAIGLIVSDAFTGKAAAGGAVGAFVVGMRRAVYSSEAGIGSAVIAHAQARTKDPASEGLVALLEPFFDTVVICSLGAIAMVLAGTYAGEYQGIEITSAAFATVSTWFPYLLTVAVFLFGFSTLCAWGFYGQQAWSYFFGDGPVATFLFRVLYLAGLPMGAALELEQVVKLVDSAFFLMAIPNIVALYVFAPQIRKEMSDYLQKVKGATP